VEAVLYAGLAIRAGLDLLLLLEHRIAAVAAIRGREASHLELGLCAALIALVATVVVQAYAFDALGAFTERDWLQLAAFAVLEVGDAIAAGLDGL